MNSWVRLWRDMPTDPKWRVIARNSKQPLPCVIALYTMMLTVAGNSEKPGSIEKLSIEDAAAALDMDEESVSSIMSAMEGRVTSSGRLTGWEKRQPKREDDKAAERKRAQRARESGKNNDASRNVTQGHAPEADTDSEADQASASEIEIEFGLVADIARLAGISTPDTGAIAKQSSTIHQWTQRGASADLIRKTVGQVMAKGVKPRSLHYFTPAIDEAIKAHAPGSTLDAGAMAILQSLGVAA